MLKGYPSNLTEPEWAPHLPKPKPGGRPRSTDLRKTVNGILYVLRSGCQWQMLPQDFPPYQTVYDYFRTWRKSGVWERLHDTLRGDVRKVASKSCNGAGLLSGRLAG